MLYNTQVSNIPEADKDYYILASIVSQNYKNRQIVTWIKSERFEFFLKKYFGLEVAFSISQRREICDGVRIKHFEVLTPEKYYLIIFDRAYDQPLERQLSLLGYKEINDYIFVHHKPTVLDNYVANKEVYSDLYGNSIKSESPITIKKVVFRGGNNHIIIGKNVIGGANMTFDLSNNSTVIFEDSNSINAPARFETIGSNGCAEICFKEKCRFTGGLFRLYVSQHNTVFSMGAGSSIETKFEAHANCGKKIIIGNDCMISHNVQLWAGG